MKIEIVPQDTSSLSLDRWLSYWSWQLKKLWFSPHWVRTLSRQMEERAEEARLLRNAAIRMRVDDIKKLAEESCQL